MKARCGRKEMTRKVLKDRRSPRRRGRMGTSVRNAHVEAGIHRHDDASALQPAERRPRGRRARPRRRRTPRRGRASRPARPRRRRPGGAGASSPARAAPGDVTNARSTSSRPPRSSRSTPSRGSAASRSSSPGRGACSRPRARASGRSPRGPSRPPRAAPRPTPCSARCHAVLSALPPGGERDRGRGDVRAGGWGTRRAGLREDATGGKRGAGGERQREGDEGGGGRGGGRDDGDAEGVMGGSGGNRRSLGRQSSSSSSSRPFASGTRRGRPRGTGRTDADVDDRVAEDGEFDRFRGLHGRVRRCPAQ